MGKRVQQKNDDWLIDAEVQYEITSIHGRWEVSLIFIDIKDPKQILIQKIGDYQSERLAKIYAQNMQKTASRDPGGIKKVDKDAYHINNN